MVRRSSPGPNPKTKAYKKEWAEHRRREEELEPRLREFGGRGRGPEVEGLIPQLLTAVVCLRRSCYVSLPDAFSTRTVLTWV